MSAREPVTIEARPATDSDRPSRHAWLVAVSAGLGYLFDSYVVNIYSFVLPLIAASFALSTTAQGVIGSVLLAGYTLGTFGFGFAADRFGRRDTMGASILLYGVTTAVSGLANGVGLFGALWTISRSNAARPTQQSCSTWPHGDRSTCSQTGKPIRSPSG